MKDQASGQMLLKMPGHPDGDVPFTASFMPHLDPEMDDPPGVTENEPDADDDEYQKRMDDLEDASFAKGFAWGLGYGGLDMVKSTGESIVGAAKFVGRGVMQVGLRFTWAVGWITGQDNSAVNEWITEVDAAQGKVVGQGLEIAKFLGSLLVDTAVILPKLEIALLSGDLTMLETALHGSETHRKVFSMVSEVLTQTVNDLTDDNRTDGQKGYIIGKIVFEVVSFIIPQTKLGKMMAMAKGELIGKLVGKAKNVGSKLLGTKAKAVGEGIQVACVGGCFASGTPVLTSKGSCGIETLVKNDVVWSSNEDNPAESGWKRVKRTFIHHVSRLNYLTLEHHDVAGATHTETFGVTPEHPVWVIHADGAGGFVAAADAHVGERMRSAAGLDVTITANSVEASSPGRSFPVYNFEVENYHTYHVGQSSVLVHNANGCKLAEVFDDQAKSQIVRRAFENNNANPSALYQELSFHQGKRMSQMEKTKFVDRILNDGLDDVQDKLDTHFLELADDIEKGFTGKEGFVGARFEAVSKKRLRRSNDANFDFYDDSVPPKKWDAVGPFPFTDIPEGSMLGGGNWWQAIEKHFKDPNKGNPVIDLAGLDHRQQSLVIRAAEGLKKQYPGKEFWIIAD